MYQCDSVLELSIFLSCAARIRTRDVSFDELQNLTTLTTEPHKPELCFRMFGFCFFDPSFSVFETSFISWETKMTFSSSQDLKFSFFIRRRLLRFTIFLSNVYEQKNIASRFMITYMTISFLYSAPFSSSFCLLCSWRETEKTWKSDMTRNQLFFKSSIVQRKIKKSTSRPV